MTNKSGSIIYSKSGVLGFQPSTTITKSMSQKKKMVKASISIQTKESGQLKLF